MLAAVARRLLPDASSLAAAFTSRCMGGPGPRRSTAVPRVRTQNMREDCIVCWTTWIPAFLVNFSVMPMWGRVPFVAAVSFGFTTYFSFLRGGPSDDAG